MQPYESIEANLIQRKKKSNSCQKRRDFWLW